VEDIRFTQWSIWDTFSNGSSVVELIRDLVEGRITAEDVPPIDISRNQDGAWWSTSNRRLVFKHCGIMPRLRIRPWDCEFQSKWLNGQCTRQCTQGLTVAVKQRSGQKFPKRRYIDYARSELHTAENQCHACRKAFGSGSSLWQHRRDTGHVFLCRVCGKGFWTHDGMMQHMRAKHHWQRPTVAGSGRQRPTAADHGQLRPTTVEDALSADMPARSAPTVRSTG